MAGRDAGMLPTSPTALSGSANARMVRVEGIVQQLQQDQGTFATAVNTANAVDRQRMLSIEVMIRDREEAIKAAFDGMTATRAGELAKVVADAKSEFDTQRQLLQGVTTAVQAEFAKLQQEHVQLQQQVNAAAAAAPATAAAAAAAAASAAGGHKDGGSRGGKSFLPVKELKPPLLAKEEQWRAWSEHFAEYLEASCSGMKSCLQSTAAADDKPDQSIVSLSSEFSHLADRAEALYSALKHLTEEGSAARRVITSTPKEDGFAAWWSLNSTFTQALAARQGAVMSQFTNTHSKPGKNLPKPGISSSRWTTPSSDGAKSWARTYPKQCFVPPMWGSWIPSLERTSQTSKEGAPSPRI